MTQAIESILAECLDAIEDGSMSVADCLAKYPEQAETLEPLLRLALDLQAVPLIAPRPAFQATAKLRLLDRLERGETAPPPPAPQPITADLPLWWQRLFAPRPRPWAVGATTLLIVIGIISLVGLFNTTPQEPVVEGPVPTATASAAEMALGHWEMARAYLDDIQQALAEDDTVTAVQTLERFVAQVNQVQAAVQTIAVENEQSSTAEVIQSKLYETQIELAQLPQLSGDQAVVEAVNSVQQTDETLQTIIRERTTDPINALLLESEWAGDSLSAAVYLSENGYPTAAEAAVRQYVLQMNLLFNLLDEVTSPNDLDDLVVALTTQQQLLLRLDGQVILTSALMEQIWNMWHLLTGQLVARWPNLAAVLNLTATPSLTPSATSTMTPSHTPTPTLTPSPTHTPTLTPTPTPTNTRWPTVTPSATAVPAAPPPPPPPAPATATFTPSPTASATATFTPSPTMTYTPTLTHTLTPTLTPTFTLTPTPSKTPISEPSPTPTKTPIPEYSPTPSKTPIPTDTPEPTATPQSNHTPIPSLTPTRKPHDAPTPTPEVITPTPQIGNILTLVATIFATPIP